MCAGASCTSDPLRVAIILSEKKRKCSILGRQRGDLNVDQLMGVVSYNKMPVQLVGNAYMCDIDPACDHYSSCVLGHF